MPVNEAAASSWERNTTADKWERGIQNSNSTPSEGLTRAGVDMAGRGGELDNKWRTNASSEAARSKYNDDTGNEQAQKWLNSMSSAADWNI